MSCRRRLLQGVLLLLVSQLSSSESLLKLGCGRNGAAGKDRAGSCKYTDMVGWPVKWGQNEFPALNIFNAVPRILQATAPLSSSGSGSGSGSTQEGSAGDASSSSSNDGSDGSSSSGGSSGSGGPDEATGIDIVQGLLFFYRLDTDAVSLPEDACKTLLPALETGINLLLNTSAVYHDCSSAVSVSGYHSLLASVTMSLTELEQLEHTNTTALGELLVGLASAILPVPCSGSVGITRLRGNGTFDAATWSQSVMQWVCNPDDYYATDGDQLFKSATLCDCIDYYAPAPPPPPPPSPDYASMTTHMYFLLYPTATLSKVTPTNDGLCAVLSNWATEVLAMALGTDVGNFLTTVCIATEDDLGYSVYVLNTTMSAQAAIDVVNKMVDNNSSALRHNATVLLADLALSSNAPLECDAQLILQSNVERWQQGLLACNTQYLEDDDSFVYANAMGLCAACDTSEWPDEFLRGSDESSGELHGSGSSDLGSGSDGGDSSRDSSSGQPSSVTRRFLIVARRSQQESRASRLQYRRMQ